MWSRALGGFVQARVASVRWLQQRTVLTGCHAFGVARADLVEYKQQVIEGYEAAEDACDALLYVLEQEDLCQSLKESGNWTPEYLATHHEVDAACMDAFFRCAKYKYECGEWDPAAKYLHDYAYVGSQAAVSAATLVVVWCFATAHVALALTCTLSCWCGRRSQLVPESSPQGLAALWGKLVSEILSEAWDEALHNLQKLKIAVDKSFGSALEQLQQRSWMLHWSLFIFFNHPDGQDNLVDFYLACVAAA